VFDVDELTERDGTEPMMVTVGMRVSELAQPKAIGKK
jgi:hypothetical protein